MPRSNVIVASAFKENASACPQVYTDQRVSIISIVCRICYDTEKEEPLITPCRCKGTVAFVHRSCLETWLAESNTTTCELCHQVFKTERTPKYTSLKSIWKWVRISPGNQRGARGVKSDLFACGLLTPIAIIITYICLFSSDYYNQKKFSTIPAARWTSLSLLFMIAIMLIGYYLWVYSVIRMHARMWYNWWQRECVVKYVPPSTVNICPDCPSRLHTPHNTPLTRTSSIDDLTQRSGEPRGHSVFRIENEETEIYHECLERVSEYLQKSNLNAMASDVSINIENETGDEKSKKDRGALSLIKNEGFVYILNFTEPKNVGEPDNVKSTVQSCLDSPSMSSDDSSGIHIYPIAKIDEKDSNISRKKPDVPIHNSNVIDVEEETEVAERLSNTKSSTSENLDQIVQNNSCGCCSTNVKNIPANVSDLTKRRELIIAELDSEESSSDDDEDTLL